MSEADRSRHLLPLQRYPTDQAYIQEEVGDHHMEGVTCLSHAYHMSRSHDMHKQYTYFLIHLCM